MILTFQCIELFGQPACSSSFYSTALQMAAILFTALLITDFVTNNATNHRPAQHADVGAGADCSPHTNADQSTSTHAKQHDD
jgi:hypothetical protein